MNDIIFGVDPSYRAFGIVVYHAGLDKILNCYTIRTKKESKIRETGVGTDDVRRVTDLTREYRHILGVHKPVLIFSETPTGGSLSQKGAKGMAYATAVTTIVPLMIMGNTVVHVTARDSKKAATGKVDGSKEAVMRAVKARFPGAPFSDIWTVGEHQYDAAATLMAGMLTPIWELATKGK